MMALKLDLKPTGFRYWMLRVLDECENVSADFSADPVHDLRVALRRCRSLADGMIAMDPDPSWKAMKKAGKQLFQRLGNLRDVQIMMEWIEKLEGEVRDSVEKQLPIASTAQADGLGTAPEDAPGVSNQGRDPAAQALMHILKARESDHKNEARRALEEFDRKQWRQWSRSLPHRAARIRPGSAVFKHLALERFTTARELHVRAMRNRSQVALHTLRIGIKRFRYIVENFLPEEHGAWSDDLKHMQDLLGEVHDLDVLWATANSCHVFPGEASRKAWHAKIIEERTRRINEYREKTIGPESLWNIWRAGLPQGKEIQEIASRRMKVWAKALDPDFAHSERVARLSLQLYDGLTATGLLRTAGVASSADGDVANLRLSLNAAALLHDVGMAKGKKGHHKESLELIKKHGTPLGWKEEDMRRAALVARFHTGALPSRAHKALRDLLPEEQRNVIRLSALLRLANALDSSHDGHIRSVKIENAVDQPRSKNRTNGFLRKAPALAKNEAIVILAEGYLAGTPTAQSVAAERYLLETVLRRPVIVRGAAATWRPVPGIRH
jgi:CHAD domain-containing protein/HD superfamily phosphodiesterase